MKKTVEVLRQINTNTRALVVALAVVESICIAIVGLLPVEMRIWGLVSCLVALVLMTVLLVVLAKIEKPLTVVPPSASPLYDPIFVRIDSRAELYQKATELLNGAKKYILDTTWASDVTNNSQLQDAAKQTYLQTQHSVISRGLDYRELFAVTEGRKKRLTDARALGLQHKNYQVQEIEAPSPSISMLDFIVVDGVHVLLSHVDAARQKPEQNYVYIKSELLALVFKDLFEVCWTRAKSGAKSKDKQ